MHDFVSDFFFKGNTLQPSAKWLKTNLNRRFQSVLIGSFFFPFVKQKNCACQVKPVWSECEPKQRQLFRGAFLFTVFENRGQLGARNANFVSHVFLSLINCIEDLSFLAPSIFTSC